MLNELSDEAIQAMLIERGTQGVAQAIAIYNQRLRRAIRLRLSPQVSSRLDESDVLQETYLVAMRELASYLASPNVSVFVWLRHLVTRHVIDLHRKHLNADKRTTFRESFSIDQYNDAGAEGAWALTEALISREGSPSSDIRREEKRVQLCEALGKMSAIDREILMLRHFELLSNSETAAVLGLSPSAASNRRIRALQRLGRILHDLRGTS